MLDHASNLSLTLGGRALALKVSPDLGPVQLVRTEFPCAVAAGVDASVVETAISLC